MDSSPGEFVSRDYRRGVDLYKSTDAVDTMVVEEDVSFTDLHSSRANLYDEGMLKVLSWNIERGYELAGIVEELRRQDADIVCLQEVDVCTGRPEAGPGAKIASDLPQDKECDCLHTIGAALRLNLVAAVEMKFDGGGVMTNVILTKFDFEEAIDGALPHAQERRYEESFPRSGRRTAARAVVKSHLGDVLVYSDHFEMHYGMEARLSQLDHILQDAHIFQDDVIATLICGDLNNYSGGIARIKELKVAGLTPLTRATMFSLNEAEMWRDCIFGPGQANHPLRKEFPDLFPDSSLCIGWSHDDIRNTTVEVSFLYSQKIDWILSRGDGFAAIKRALFNHDLSKSDHKGVIAQFSLQ